MSRVLEYQIKGKSDVEQVVGRAKASMGQLNQFTSAIGKKLGEFGKDFAMRFVAPMMLLDRAMNMIADHIEENRRKTQEAKAFLTAEESKGVADPVLREFARRGEQESVQKDLQEKIARGQEIMIAEFLAKQDSDANAIMAQARSRVGRFATPELVAKDEEVQKRVMEIFRKRFGEAVPPSAKATEDMTKATSVSGNVIGVGQSPVIAAMNEQTELLRSIDMKLTPDKPALTPDPNLTKKAPLMYPQFK